MFLKSFGHLALLLLRRVSILWGTPGQKEYDISINTKGFKLIMGYHVLKSLYIHTAVVRAQSRYADGLRSRANLAWALLPKSEISTALQYIEPFSVFLSVCGKLKRSAGCAPRGEEVKCFALPLGRKRVASDSLLYKFSFLVISKPK